MEAQQTSRNKNKEDKKPNKQLKLKRLKKQTSNEIG
jgi:hypothetical protein